MDPNDPEFRAFVKAMKDSPRDDTPRLVFADWLDEHGHETYAGFLRSMIAVSKYDWSNRLSLSGWDHVPIRALFGGDHARALQAIKKTWATWEAVEHAGPAAVLWRWHRGTIDSLTIDWQTWYRWWPTLTAFGPVGEVVLYNRPPTVLEEGITENRVRLQAAPPGRERAWEKAVVVITREVWRTTPPGVRWRYVDLATEDLLRQVFGQWHVGNFQIDDEALNALTRSPPGPPDLFEGAWPA